MRNSNQILLVEDDANFGYILKEYLEIHDLNVTLAHDGEEGLNEFKKGHFDLCILDVMMPVKDGFTLAKDIRTIDPEIPFIFLTAKALKVDKLKGFRLGCDDYVVKPIDEELFIARVKAIMKRTCASAINDSSIFQIGEYCFDYNNHSLIRNGQTQRLTEKEARILYMLCEKKNEVLDRSKALKSIWGENDFFNRKSMDVFIHKLRKYLEHDESIKITNVHGRGFVLEDLRA
ncbi:MAG: response regulator transcription factor [bacterium]|nr:response regulator transcription factor [bacterium]